MLVSDLSESVSLSTTARFLPPPPVKDEVLLGSMSGPTPTDVKDKDDEEEDDEVPAPATVFLTFAVVSSGSGVQGLGLGTGNSLSSKVGTRDWSKS